MLCLIFSGVDHESVCCQGHAKVGKYKRRLALPSFLSPPTFMPTLCLSVSRGGVEIAEYLRRGSHVSNCQVGSVFMSFHEKPPYHRVERVMRVRRAEQPAPKAISTIACSLRWAVVRCLSNQWWGEKRTVAVFQSLSLIVALQGCDSSRDAGLHCQANGCQHPEPCREPHLPKRERVALRDSSQLNLHEVLYPVPRCDGSSACCLVSIQAKPCSRR